MISCISATELMQVRKEASLGTEEIFQTLFTGNTWNEEYLVFRSQFKSDSGIFAQIYGIGEN